MVSFIAQSLIWLATAVGVHYYTRKQASTSMADDALELERFSCRPFLPKLFVETPPPPNDPSIVEVTRKVDTFLSDRFSQGDIDGLSVAVVTSVGAIFEKNWGVQRGNESASSPPMTSHSIHRISSVVKIFPVMEGLVLEQKGIISWDDPVEKYLPDFRYRLDGYAPSKSIAKSEEAPITLFQLASHMSGLGRDWPPGTVHGFPHDMQGGGPPPTNGLPFPDHAAMLRTIIANRLVTPPFAYPAYSNTGIALLGMALVSANRMASKFPETEPNTFADLIARDIFEPMGMNSSSFLATEKNKHLVVVPSLAPEVADQDFLDAMNPAAGQFSSLRDFVTVVETILNPSHPKSVLTRYSRDKWLRPVHDFEEDDWTEIGTPWEIIKAPDSNGRLRKIYWKLGAMAGYHGALAIHPGSSYGVVLLLSGHYPDAAKLTYDVFSIMQSGIDEALSAIAHDMYAGTWSSVDATSRASIVVDKGTLYVEKLFLNGSNVLQKFHAPGRLALRSSERRDEFRLDTGIPFYNGQRHMGCYPYWNGQDLWGMRNNAPINQLYFSGSGKERTLHYPSAEVAMTRA
ncbi:hypothetical protein NM688_g4225 [Phlebia brevispora]|uniref:Uncharacterized protein n=1 Tax=Phlebia brevispora TaxID=194682 RepID=A0ACC1T3H5_9APHY|nr:hypothetical protein NM688_g4225 [Phlebia brevispora]